MDEVNARYLDASMPAAPAVLVCDASFISLKKLLPAALALAAPMTFLVALIKPQFEVVRGGLAKAGWCVMRRFIATLWPILKPGLSALWDGDISAQCRQRLMVRMAIGSFCLSGKRQGLISPAETRTGRDVASTNQPRQATSSPRQPARRECQHMGHAALWSRHRHFDHQHRSICVASRSMTSV